MANVAKLSDTRKRVRSSAGLNEAAGAAWRWKGAEEEERPPELEGMEKRGGASH
jgi:hypothetical protein